jgi:dipeptidase D
MSNAIEGLKPEGFWRCFAEIARIPRPSGHEERIAQFVLDRAKSLGLEALQDAAGNVVVRKPAAPGRESVPYICLQSHLDMVCEKNADKSHDFLKDPIELVRKGDVLCADGTTLGADNGVGVATSLAIMEDASLEHGPLEMLFTLEEETGLRGALNLSPDLLLSRTLLNLDSEEEGILYVGCAGGRDTLGHWAIATEPAPQESVAVTLSVKGLRGGHSGLEIDKGFGNAIKILNRALLALSDLGASISQINGGNMRNAIPRECSAVVYLPKQKLDELQSLISTLNKIFKDELSPLEPDLALSISSAADSGNGSVFEKALQEKLLLTISAMPTGVQHMSLDIPGLVETSTNLSVISTTDNEIVIVTSQRSSVASRLTEIAQSVKAIFELGGARVEGSDGYPGWKPDLDSRILKVAKDCYRALYGRDVEVQAIHAGLECGIIGERVPGMDMISFGPTLQSVHSPDERIYIESVQKFWDFLLEILKKAH